jgi:hypothetical protein
VKGKTLTWVVDSDRFSLCDLNMDLLKELGWRRGQAPKIWILDKNDGREAGLVSESQIPEIFKMYEKERVIVLHVVASDSNGSSNCSGTNVVYPCTPAQLIPSIEMASQSQAGSTHGCFHLNEHMYNFDGEKVPVAFPDSIMTPDQTLANSLHENSTMVGTVQQDVVE